MNYQAVILTTLAGIATIIGYFFIYLKEQSNKIIPSALGFSAGIMIFISLFDLLPKSFNYFSEKYLNFYSIFLCFFFLLLGSAIVISTNNLFTKKYDNHLYQIGLLALITLMLHNIPEGIITYLTSVVELKTGAIMALSIACHNIPEGICIAIPIYYSTGKKIKAFLMVLLSAVSEPLGAFLAYAFFEKYLSNMLIAVLLSLVSGMMLALVVSEILKEAKNYSKKQALIFFIIGIFSGLMAHLLF